MTNSFTDPVLLPEERSFLTSSAAPLKMAKRTLDKLEAAGIDVTPEREMVERTEFQRAGLLKQFGVRRPTAE